MIQRKKKEFLKCNMQVLHKHRIPDTSIVSLLLGYVIANCPTCFNLSSLNLFFSSSEGLIPASLPNADVRRLQMKKDLEKNEICC